MNIMKMNRCDQCTNSASSRCIICFLFLCQCHSRAHLRQESSHFAIKLPHLTTYSCPHQAEKAKYSTTLNTNPTINQSAVSHKYSKAVPIQYKPPIFSFVHPFLFCNHPSVSSPLEAYSQRKITKSNYPSICEGKQANIFINKQYGLFIQGHVCDINSVAMSSDNRYIVTASSDWTIIVWDIEKKKQVAVLLGHVGSVKNVLITNDNKFIVSTSEDKTIRVWNFIDQVAVIEGHTD